MVGHKKINLPAKWKDKPRSYSLRYFSLQRALATRTPRDHHATASGDARGLQEAHGENKKPTQNIVCEGSKSSKHQNLGLQPHTLPPPSRHGSVHTKKQLIIIISGSTRLRGVGFTAKPPQGRFGRCTSTAACPMADEKRKSLCGATKKSRMHFSGQHGCHRAALQGGIRT